MMYKKVISGLIVSGLAFFSHADSKVLTPEKGGTLNHIFEQGQQPELTVATYNIAAARVSDLKSIAAAIKKIDADLIALNEVDNKTKRSGNVAQPEELARLTGMHVAFGKAIDFEGGEYGIAILSKYPITKTQVFKLPSGNDEQRVLLIAEVQKPGLEAPILFMTTHLDWQENPEIRLQQIREIENITIGNTDSVFGEIASRIKILAGDFNDVQSGTSIVELKRYWNPVLKADQDFRSWPAANPALDLDHIFTFKGQRWSVSQITVPHSKSVWSDINWPDVSDHLPVKASLKLTEQ